MNQPDNMNMPGSHPGSGATNQYLIDMATTYRYIIFNEINQKIVTDREDQVIAFDSGEKANDYAAEFCGSWVILKQAMQRGIWITFNVSQAT